MWSEILKVKPQADAASLNKMHRDLSRRFGDVAKKFGGGIKNALLGGGLVAVASGIINKILNPLKDTEETLQRMLAMGDDISDSAKQFETTSGNLAKLQTFGVASGLDPEELNMMLGKFQVALAEARAEQNDPTKAPQDKTMFNLLKNFVGEKDTAEAFFAFIQSLQKVDKDTQVLAQKNIFGEKQIRKQSDFLNQDFGKLTQELGGVSTTKLGGAAESLGGLQDKANLNKAKRFQDELVNNADVIKPSFIDKIDQAERAKMKTENERLAQFEFLKTGAIAAQQISDKFENLSILLSTQVPIFVQNANAWFTSVSTKIDNLTTRLSDYLSKIAESRLLKGLGLFGGGDSPKRK